MTEHKTVLTVTIIDAKKDANYFVGLIDDVFNDHDVAWWQTKIVEEKDVSREEAEKVVEGKA